MDVGAIFVAFAAGIFLAPVYWLIMWLGRRGERRKKLLDERKANEYADEFRRREEEFEKSLMKDRQP